MGKSIIIVLEDVICASCGCTFGVDENHLTKLRISHHSFYCPSGHANVYSNPTDDDKIKRDVERKSKELLSLYAELKRKDQEIVDAFKEINELKQINALNAEAKNKPSGILRNIFKSWYSK